MDRPWKGEDGCSAKKTGLLRVREKLWASRGRRERMETLGRAQEGAASLEEQTIAWVP